MMRDIGKLWSHLDQEQKHYYNVLAKEDKLRYQKDLKNFEMSGGS